MKKGLKITGIIIAALLFILGIFLYYMGMFSTIAIEEKEMGPFTYAYVEHIGPYTEVGEPMNELDEKMRSAGFTSTNGIGIYYDDPKKTAKEDLRSEIGSIITEEDMEKVEENEENLNFATLEKRNYLVAEFPIKNMMSYMFGPMKVYPAFAKHLESLDIEVPDKGIEIYDMENNKILYMMEFDK